MAIYRCYFLGSNGQLVGAETIVSPSDDQALAVAREKLAEKVYAKGFDLREGIRTIATQHVQAS